MIKVPFKIIDEVHQKEYNAKYEVGFIGWDKNEKNEVFPVEGQVFSILNKKQNKKEEEQEKEEEKNSIILMKKERKKKMMMMMMKKKKKKTVKKKKKN